MLCVKLHTENTRIEKRATEQRSPSGSAFAHLYQKRGSFPSLSVHGSAPCALRPSFAEKFAIAASFGRRRSKDHEPDTTAIFRFQLE